MTNVEMIAKSLAEHGVRWVFGVPSGPVLRLIEAIRNQPGLDFVLTASETSAGFMAETVGRLTGIPGVCVSTLGPGVTNLATGLGSAWLDRSPVVALTCTYPQRMMGRRTQMLIDHQALLSPIVKSSTVMVTNTVSHSIANAIAEACDEPAGPVHLELPEDVGTAITDEGLVQGFRLPESLYSPPDFPDLLGRLLGDVHRPIIVLGSEISRARNLDLLLSFIERFGIPFVTTVHAKGYLPESHPACMGVMGRARRSDVQALIDRSDLIVTIGYDPVEIDYEDWAAETSVVHISREPLAHGTAIELAHQFVGDLGTMLGRLAEIETTSNDWAPEELIGHMELFDRNLRPTNRSMATYHVLDALRDILPPDGILAYDVGAHTHQIASQWRTDFPGTALATNGWSSMGYGMPSAYAAKLVNPDRAVVGVVGDGGFQMTVGELAMAKRLGLQVPIVVLNDGWLALMKVKQEHLETSLADSFLGAPQDPPAHYFGVPVVGAKDQTSFRQALTWALSHSGPSVIEAFIDATPYSYSVFDGN